MSEKATITKRNSPQQNLRENERWRSLANTMPQFVWTAHVFGDAEFINQYWFDYTGLPPGTFTLESWQQVVHPDDIAEIGRMWNRALQSGEEQSFEYRVRRADGAWRWHLGFHRPERDAAGNIARWVGVAFDIHDRKLAEEALRQREAELSRLLATLPDVISRFDRDLRFLYASPAIERFTGMPPAWFIGKTHAEAGIPEQLSRHLHETLAEIFSTGRSKAIEFDFVSPSGLLHLTGLGVPETDEAGNLISVLTVVRDVTARRQAENKLSASLDRERDARQTAELLNRVGPTLAAELDLERLMQSVTDIATELVGAEFGSFFHNITDPAGESYMLYTLSGVPKEAFASFPMPRSTDLFAPTFRGEGIVRSDDVTKDPRYGRNAPHAGMPKGHLPVRSYLAVPVVSRSGIVLGGLFFGHSQTGRFTERHEALVSGLAGQAAIAMDNAHLFEQAQRAQHDLLRSNDELRRANKDLETFAYSASHDLQEPLRTISISAQLLSRKLGELDGDSKRFLTSVLEGVQRMQALLQDLLSYTRATRHSEARVEAVNVNAVLDRVVLNLKPLIEQTQARIEYPQLPSVIMEESHVTQLFQNLIGNALKYRNAEAPHVQIYAVEGNGSIIFSVADNGIGIEQKYADRIFELFKRRHTREQYPGSGIGLAICQRIVEQYGGRIWLDQSTPGEGSVFSFAIPIRAVG